MRNYLADAIKSLRPSAEFSYTDNNYSTIQWIVLDGEAPTQAEIDAEIARIKAAEIDQENDLAVKKAALLERLGITEDEAKLLLG
jgi:hypothetical protein